MRKLAAPLDDCTVISALAKGVVPSGANKEPQMVPVVEASQEARLCMDELVVVVSVVSVVAVELQLANAVKRVRLKKRIHFFIFSPFLEFKKPLPHWKD
jgi:hypothetical protein